MNNWLKICFNSFRQERVKGFYGKKTERFFDAIKRNDYEYIKQAINRNFNINVEDKDGYTGLHKAILSNNIEMSQFLIQNGAIINDMSCLYAAALGQIQTIKILIKNGVDVNVKDSVGWTPLHWASQEGYTDVVRLLLENNADINVQEEDGQTPLYIAAAEGQCEVVKCLLVKGAEVNLSSFFGTTPFGIACAVENYQEMKLLLNYGANIDYRDMDGRTPLFYAKILERIQMIEFLMENGANANLIDNFGISILDLADEKIRGKIFEELY